MSDMYAVKASTLTAIGDAIRGKQGIVCEYITFVIESGFHNKSIHTNLKSSRFKYIITGTSEEYATPSTLRIYTLKNGSQTEVYFKNFVRAPDTFGTTIENTDANGLVFMCPCNGNNKIIVNITAIPLDENGDEYKYTPLEMAEAINEMMALPSSALNITGSCMYKFSSDGWNWFIEDYGDKITTSEISNASFMFNDSRTLTKIPFDINLSKSATTLEQMFKSCYELEDIPNVSWTEMPTSTVIVKTIFTGCRKIKEIPEWFIELCEYNHNTALAKGSWSDFGPFSQLFDNCNRIRKIPERLMAVLWNPVATGTYYTLIYSNPFSSMYAVDELINMRFEDIALTSNEFSSWFSSLNHISRITMATNEDGSPLVRKWKSQTWDLTRTTFGYGRPNELDFTHDKRVHDEATYQALKNDPDWWSYDVNYSQYNHDSAVETINSLPDTSAYGTNTIKFKGVAGALTDGGAINTLTEEEIAVATAKGWTVTFV